jgi:hypothetical protein
MMLCDDLLSLCLRIGELAFSAVVAGLTGKYLHDEEKGVRAWNKKRFIYTEVIAAIGILFSLLFLLPFASSFIHWPIDFLLFAGFMVAFGLLANYIGPNCGSIWNWNAITKGGSCDQFKADIAFSFLASIFFLASAILGIWVVHKRRRSNRTVATDGVTGRRRRWYRRSYV